MATRRRRQFIYRTTAIYVAAATAWIVLSDQLLGHLADPALITGLATLKGLAFIAITAPLLVLALRRVPPRQAGSPERAAAPSRPPWAMLAAFFLLAAALVLIGVLAYRAQAAAMKQEVFGDLQAVGRLKIDTVSEWLGERRASAAVFSRNPLTAQLLARWLDRRGDDDLEALREVLRQERGASGFDTIALLEPSGHLLLADGTPPEPGEIEPASLEQARRSGEIAFQDLRLRQSDSSVHLAFLAPIFQGTGAGRRLLAIAMLQADAGTYLYPYLLAWPQQTDSGEAVLARREGDSVLLLSDLRFRAHTRLRLRLPLSESRMPAVRAARGERGPVEGIDYRGQRVLAAVAAVPGTPWLLIAKLDEREALAEVRRLASMTAIMTLLAVACAAAAIALLWQRSQLRAAQVQAAQAQALRERVNLRDYLAKIVGTLPGAIYSTRVRPDGTMCIPYTSPNFRDVCGIDPDAVVHDAAAAFAAVHPEDLPAMRASIAESIRTTAPWRHEYRVKHPEKGEIWLEARTVPDPEPGGGTSWHGFIWDITQRKSREANLRQAATVFTGTHEGVVITDPRGIVLAVNPAFTQVSGYAEDELVGHKISMMQSGRHDAAFYRAMWESIHSTGYWQGEIWDRRKNGEIFPAWATISAVRNGHGEVTSCVGAFSDISRIKDSEARLRHLADHDSLTGLPNRGALIATLTHAMARCSRAGGSLAVMFLDLDRFKNVNDSFGHIAGDELLCLVAQRLRARLRNADTLARLGGDEFVVLLEDIAGAEAVGQLAQELIEALSRPFTLERGKEACVGCSIGISLYPRDSADANELIQHADAALYQAKASGRGTYRFFETELTRAAVRRMEMEGRLRRALECGEFSLQYQPLVSLADGRVRGAEALLRWYRPGGGAAPPDFIPVAEDTGLIVPIGDWALRSACAQIGEWRRRGQGPQFVSVNLSPHQFHRHDIVERVRAALKETGVDGAWLELEITESALLQSGPESELKLRGLTALGVRLSIDDFGTGYSSLAYLKRLPISKLKIAQQFILDLLQNAADTEIATAIISMGKSLKLEVLAEGVETPAQLEFLRERGCDTAQGFLFSSAVSGAEIEALCLKQPWLLQPAA